MRFLIPINKRFLFSVNWLILREVNYVYISLEYRVPTKTLQNYYNFFPSSKYHIFFSFHNPSVLNMPFKLI